MLGPDANKIFTTLLKLEEPWFVENVEATSECVDIYLSTRAKALVECPVCGDRCKITTGCRGHMEGFRCQRCGMFCHCEDTQMRMSQMRRQTTAGAVGTRERLVHREFRATGDVADAEDAANQGGRVHACRDMGSGRHIEISCPEGAGQNGPLGCEEHTSGRDILQTRTQVHHRDRGCRYQRDNIHDRGQGFRFLEIVL